MKEGENMRENTKKCPYCAEEILAEAIKCKHCGEYLSKPASKIEPNPVKVQTIEVTGKKWKAWKLVGGLTMFIGSSALALLSNSLPVGGITFFVGLLIFSFSGFGAWWHHA